MDRSPSITALEAAGMEAQVTAHNLVNMNTPGFKASRVILEDLPERGGVRAQGVYNRVPDDYRLPKLEKQQDYAVASHIPERVQGSAFNLEREMAKLVNLHLFLDSNAVGLVSWDKMTGTILDLVA